MYRLGQVGTGTLAHDLNRLWAKVRGKTDPFAMVGQENDREQAGGEYVWALQDINLEIEQGQILGIIGRNGAGKSTLLKLLSRVTAPTTGRIVANGRMASLLEVGTGFHPELTGRENIFLNGAILGMTRPEIKKQFDDIVDFSGCNKYVDTPVKRYSSGMYVRLAFAVAAHLEPEILIVDEVLAVGDADFQSRCIGKMEDVSKNSGRTILFVSHNMASVRRLCGQSCLLVNGKLESVGETGEIIERYLEKASDTERLLEFPAGEEPGKDGVQLDRIEITDEAGRTSSRLTSESSIDIRIQYTLQSSFKNLRITVSLFAGDGSHVLSVSDFNEQHESRIRNAGRHTSCLSIPSDFLNLGRYSCSIDLDVPMQKPLIMGQGLSFTIDELSVNHLGITQNPRPPGAIHPRLRWSMERTENEAVAKPTP